MVYKQTNTTSKLKRHIAFKVSMNSQSKMVFKPEEQQIFCEIESLWISYKIKKIYYTARLTKHFVMKNEVVEDSRAKISISLSFEDPKQLTDIISATQNVCFSVEPTFKEIFDSSGFRLKRFCASSVQCVS